MITGNEDISIGGEDVPKARSLNVTSKALRFAHKFTGGETALNLGSLIMPSEISTWSNPSSSEIAAANLLSTSANLIIKSSTGAELMEGVDFVVTSNSGLAFINGYSPQPGEIIIGRFNLPVSSILVSDAKEYRKTVPVVAGQTIVNVGFEYKVNQNPTQQIGDVRVNLNGLSKLLRNVGNATAAPLADGNYEEYDPTNSGYSTAIRLNNPIAADGFMVFEGGLALASADVKIFGALDRLGAIVTKLAEDASYGFHGDNDLTRYLTASTSEVERKTFGDLLVDGLLRVAVLEAERIPYQIKTLSSNILVDQSDIPSLRLNNLTIGKTYRLSMNFSVINGDSNGRLTAQHNGNVILRIGQKTTGVNNEDRATVGNSVIFTATATTVIFNYNEFDVGAQAEGNGTTSETFVQLEELDRHLATTQWT